MKFEVFYVERVVKKITIEAPDALTAGRNVIMEHVDVDYSKATVIDSAVWAIDKVRMVEEP